MLSQSLLHSPVTCRLGEASQEYRHRRGVSKRGGIGVSTLGIDTSKRYFNPRVVSVRTWDGSADDAKLRELVKDEVEKQKGKISIKGLQQPGRQLSDNGVLLLCLANALMYLFDHVLKMSFAQSLYLYHASPRPWQFITCAFCHANWQHLSSNIFMLYIFGKIIEEEEGPLGVILTYLVGAIGGSLAGWFVLPPHSVSLGASGAVFSLFLVAVLIKLKWNLKKLLEAGILGQFVFQQFAQEIQNQVAGGVAAGGSQISHIAHLGGGAAGGLLILLLMRLPQS